MPTTETIDALKIRATLKEAGFDRDPEEPEDWTKAAICLNQKGMVDKGRKRWTKRGLKAFLQDGALEKKESKVKKVARLAAKKSVKKAEVAEKLLAKKIPSEYITTSFKLEVSEVDDPDSFINKQTMTVEYAGATVVLNYKGPLTTNALDMAKQQFQHVLDTIAPKLKTTK